MEYISIIMNEDASHDCLAELGKLEAIQFSDVRLSHPFSYVAMPLQCYHPLTVVSLIFALVVES
jgi:vacuolar-type H+-ATPase subunit I/STV1